MAEAKKYIFEKLTPVTDSDISVYESAIDFVFENDDVKILPFLALTAQERAVCLLLISHAIPT